MKTDAQLMADVIAELAWDCHANAADVCVEVNNGVVTLLGRIDTRAERHTIERAVRRVAGDVRVQHRWVAASNRSLSSPPERSEAAAPAPSGTDTLRATLHSWALQSAQ